MNQRWLTYLSIATVFTLAVSKSGANEGKDGEIQFNRDIRPILSNNCFECHGPDQEARQTELRLDTKHGLLSKLENGAVAVVARDLFKSLVFQRITASDAEERMPPADSGKQLTAKEIGLIGRWIQQGAKWQGHWAYMPPLRPQLPKVSREEWVGNAVDRFVLARLQKEGLKPSPDANRTTLIRRLSFDLTGLPPTVAEVDAFVSDEDPGAYETIADRLLASKHYGERIAMHWLDLVRYADSGGYHSDNEHSISPYRDYVINAFNDNMPFDQFTREQLAGDQLP